LSGRCRSITTNLFGVKQALPFQCREQLRRRRFVTPGPAGRIENRPIYLDGLLALAAFLEGDPEIEARFELAALT